jgi:hypothetical protein
MLPDDGFWAAKIVARFSDEAIRALVKTGKYLDPEAERYLADVLIKRRDKIVSYYFRQINPLDDFKVEADRLEFRNLGEERGVASPDGYEYKWYAFDNETEEITPLGGRMETTEGALAIPESGSEFLMVRIRTLCPGEPRWNLSVDVYLRIEGGASVVGIDREI